MLVYSMYIIRNKYSDSYLVTVHRNPQQPEFALHRNIPSHEFATKTYLNLLCQNIIYYQIAYFLSQAVINRKVNSMSESNAMSTFPLCRPNPAPTPKPACLTCGSSKCARHGMK